MAIVKGMPTNLNLWTLNSHFNGGNRGVLTSDGQVFATSITAPNGIRPTSVSGIRRCMKFGLVEVSADLKTLTLTELGQSALCGWAFDAGR